MAKKKMVVDLMVWGNGKHRDKAFGVEITFPKPVSEKKGKKIRDEIAKLLKQI